mmetsp:Transcript_3475/g.4658  ORF Transcript_3475/g.4658 Transcript_3475/m.4658 type:complete len:488 (-) Transcript_3475:193-1656(-)
MMEDIYESITNSVSVAGQSSSDNGADTKPEQESADPKGNEYNRLQAELKRLRETLRLYEEPPNLDEQKQTIVVNGFKNVKSAFMGTTHTRYQITRKRLSGERNMAAGSSSFQNPDLSFSVYRRFSDWIFLHSLLERDLPQSLIPSPPPKKSLHKTDTDFLEMRLIQLHAFTRALADHPGVRTNQYFRQFLYLTYEQWEELTGAVTAVTSLPGSTEHEREQMGEVLQHESVSNRKNGVASFFKGLGKTGKSILYKSIGKGNTPDSELLNAESEFKDSSAAELKFIKTYRDLAVGYVDEVLLDSYGKYQHSKKGVKNGKTPVWVSDLYRKATKPMEKILKTKKAQHQLLNDLGNELRKLIDQEGTSAALGNSMLGNLTAFAGALKEMGQNELKCYNHMTEKQGDEIIFALYQGSFHLIGASEYYKKCRSLKRKNDQVLDTFTHELIRCQTNKTEILQASLESFALQQIEQANSNICSLKRLYATLCEEN